MASGSATYTIQTGNSQSATIDQSAATNGSVGTSTDPFVQQNGVGGGGNVINITQTGADDSVQGQPGGWMVNPPLTGQIGQSGTGNNATIFQSGGDVSVGGQTVELWQVGTGNGTGNIGALNGGTIDQGAGNNQSAAVIETGNYNQFNISQQGPTSLVWAPYGLYNGVDLEQSGNNNSGQISQNGIGLRVTAYQTYDYNVLTSFQSGKGNTLSSAQFNTSDGWYNTIWNNQSGWNNSANIGYGDGAGQNGTDLTITNTQFGASDSLVVANQGDGAGFNLSITNTQGGYKNSLTVTDQAGTNSSITSTQYGAKNTATVTEQSGNDNIISNWQSGWKGTATFSQTGSSNTADLTQTGNWDTATSTQTGSNSLAWLDQTGDGNTITGSQNGTGAQNAAYVTQSTNGNTASYSQSGSGNTVTIHQ